MTADWGSGSGSGLVAIGTYENRQGATTGSTGTLPVELARAATACNKVGDTNSVKWEYY